MLFRFYAFLLLLHRRMEFMNVFVYLFGQWENVFCKCIARTLALQSRFILYWSSDNFLQWLCWVGYSLCENKSKWSRLAFKHGKINGKYVYGDWSGSNAFFLSNTIFLSTFIAFIRTDCEIYSTKLIKISSQYWINGLSR